ncbi:MAG: hypothetical protein IPK99_13145 [Flavobacteriales bacterium]|nr:hypothetical protein [Flavobacteriales bacterium]
MPSDKELVTQRCFLLVSTSTDGSIVDSMSVHLAIDVGSGHATGRLDWSPGEKDAMHGTLVGQLVGDRVVAVYTYEAEGTTNKEQRILVLGTDHVAVLTAEMQEHDGTWRIKDPHRAADGMKVPEVPCR